jgi:hypothetical protein
MRWTALHRKQALIGSCSLSSLQQLPANAITIYCTFAAAGAGAAAAAAAAVEARVPTW